MPIIFDNKDFEINQEIKKQEDDEIIEEIDFTRLKDEIEFECYFGEKNYNFFLMSSRLGLNKDNENFIDFLSSEIGLQIFRENMLSIHIKTRNIFYDNYNTNEPIYSFFVKSKHNSRHLKIQRFLFKLFKTFF